MQFTPTLPKQGNLFRPVMHVRFTLRKKPVLYSAIQEMDDTTNEQEMELKFIFSDPTAQRGPGPFHT